MNRVALVLVLVVASRGGTQAAPQGPIVRSDPDKAAIAPPPPVPDVPMKEAAASAGSKKAKPWAPPPSGLDFAEVVGAPANAPLKGSVLVWIDATFYLAPKDDARTLKLATLESRKGHVGEAVPMRVVSTKGPFVEVETPPRDEADNDVYDCAWFALTSQRDVGAWRLYVKREDLAPVVAKKFAKAFDDGSHLKIEPGAPVATLADGRVAVDFKSLWVPVALPSAVAGYAYPTPAPQNAEDSSAFDPKHVLGADEVTIAGARAVVRSFWALRAERVETKGDRVAFPIDDTCGRATVIVSAHNVQPYEPAPLGAMLGGGIGSGGFIRGDRWYLPLGTRLVAEGGVASATVAHEIDVPKPAPGDKQVCVDRYPFITSSFLFPPELTRAEATELRLCAPVRAVKYEKSGSGFGGR